jgi:hypothetical protein
MALPPVLPERARLLDSTALPHPDVRFNLPKRL